MSAEALVTLLEERLAGKPDEGVLVLERMQRMVERARERAATAAEELEAGNDVDACTSLLDQLQRAAELADARAAAAAEAKAAAARDEEKGARGLVCGSFRCGSTDRVVGDGCMVFERCARQGHDPGPRCVACCVDAGSTGRCDHADHRQAQLAFDRLELAAKEGAAAAVRRALEENPGAARWRGSSALWHAARAGHLDVVRLLVDAGADMISNPNNDAISAAMQPNGGQAEVALFLLRVPSQAVCKWMAEAAPRMASNAAARGHVEVLRELLDHGVARLPLVPQYGFAGPRKPVSLLGTAASCGHVEVARLLLDRGVDVDPKDAHGFVDGSPLHAAVARNHAATAELLLERGADVCAVTESGQTPVALAVENRSGEALRVLLLHGAELDTASLSLEQAVSLGLEDEVRRLLGVHGGEAPDEAAVNAAAKAGHLPVLRLLLDRGGSASMEALSFAFDKRNEAAVRELLARGAPLEGPHGSVPLRNMFCEFSRPVPGAMREELLRNFDPADQPDDRGHTPLCEAVCGGRVFVARHLLLRGASIAWVWRSMSRERHVHSLEPCVRGAEMARLLAGHGVPLPELLEHCTHYAEVKTLVVEFGAEAPQPREPVVVDGSHYPFDETLATFLMWWHEGTHPLQEERRALEAAALAACGREMPEAVARLLGDYVHARTRGGTAQGVAL